MLRFNPSSPVFVGVLHTDRAKSFPGQTQTTRLLVTGQLRQRRCSQLIAVLVRHRHHGSYYDPCVPSLFRLPHNQPPNFESIDSYPKNGFAWDPGSLVHTCRQSLGRGAIDSYTFSMKDSVVYYLPQ